MIENSFVDGPALRQWRKGERERLVAARMAVAPDCLEAWRRAIDARLLRGFPELERATIGFCWPFRNEYDARHLLYRLRRDGARGALPVVRGPRTPMIFRLWAPGVAMAPGVYDIPYPASSQEVCPDVLLIPMNGFDRQGYRLGYGGGFFDRTISAMTPRPRLIGVTFELASIATIHPQVYDIPMDYVVTEAETYRREERGEKGIGGLTVIRQP